MRNPTPFIIRSITFSIFILGFCHSSLAQGVNSDTVLLNLFKLDIGGQGIGATYEPRLGNKMTADLSAGIGGGYDIAEGSMEIYYSKPAIFLAVTPKYFYNRQSRMRKGKETRLNSGNYLGLKLKFVAAGDPKGDYARNSILVNVHWGLQRAIANHWTFNAMVGAGYGQDIDYNFGTIYPAVDFKFSFVFFKEKN